MALKAVLFGLEGILIKDSAGDQTTGMVGARQDAISREIATLFQFLRDRNVRPIVVSNRNWVFTDESTGVRTSLDVGLQQRYGNHGLYVAKRGDMPFKPLRACVEAILQAERIAVNEAIYVGMSEKDFRTAINGGLLFLNAVWDRQEVDYGFVFKSPKEIARFIELFALKEHHWFYRIDDPVRYRSLAPFSTRIEAYTEYSEAARKAAKSGTPTQERHFFLNTLVSSLYFSGEVQDINYIACIPGHRAGYGNKHMDDVLATTGDIFRKKYLPDLIVRHRDAASNRAERIAGRQPKREVQLSTLHLTKRPLKDGDERYANLKLRDKNVLVFDDITTNGTTFEAARQYLERAGANVLMVSWLKTINTDYNVLTVTKEIDPYQRNEFSAGDIRSRSLPYHSYIVDHAAAEELRVALARFKGYLRERQSTS